MDGSDNDPYHPIYPEISRSRSRLQRILLQPALIPPVKGSNRDFKARCFYCDLIPIEPITKDHFIPISKGGSSRSCNVVPACKFCNSLKDNRFPSLPEIVKLLKRYPCIELDKMFGDRCPWHSYFREEARKLWYSAKFVLSQ